MNSNDEDGTDTPSIPTNSATNGKGKAKAASKSQASATVNLDPTLNPPSSFESQVSPPSMTLRSGRKKKRPRSIERTPSKRQKLKLSAGDDDGVDGTETATGDATVDMATVEEEDEDMDNDDANDDVNDGDNDEEMKDSAKHDDLEPQDQDNEDEPVKDAAAVTESTTEVASPNVATSATASSSINLRLPSEQTPARLAQTSDSTSFANGNGSAVGTGSSLFPSTNGVAYSGSTRLHDFETPMKPKPMNGESMHVDQQAIPFPPPPASEKPQDDSEAKDEVDNVDESQNLESKGNDEKPNENGHSDDHDVSEKDVVVGVFTQIFDTIKSLNWKSIVFPDDDSVDGEEVETLDTKLTKIHVWIVLLLACHVMLSGVTNGSMVKPLWKSVPESSLNLLGTYQSWLGIDMETNVPIIDEEKVNDTVIERQPPIIVKEEIQEVITFVDNVELEKEERELLQKRKLLSDFLHYNNLVHESVMEYEDRVINEEKIENLFNTLNSDIEKVVQKNGRLEESQKLQAWDEALSHSEVVLSEILTAKDMDKETIRDSLKQALSSLVEKSHGMLDAGSVQMFDDLNVMLPVDKPSCQEQDATNDEMKLKSEETPVRTTHEMLDVAARELQSFSLASVDRLKQDLELNEDIRKWIKNEVKTIKSESRPIISNQDKQDFKEKFENMHNGASGHNDMDGLTKQDVEHLSYTSIEKAKADCGGRFDYAALPYGATVIRDGIRRTSRSIVEDMPLINQAAAGLNLRFYGHKAEAALMPTSPKTALGQCWSFEDDGTRKRLAVDIDGSYEFDDEAMQNDPDRGDIATLAVRLAKPTHIKSVAIEHPSAKLSSNTDTAIRQFRVTGYEDADAKGRPWLLGSFEYEVGKDPVQEFMVDENELDGGRIPKLSSVVLAIDTNWGSEYSCLYRFRVHD